MAFEKMNLFGDADPKKQSQNKMVELIGEISAVFF